MNRPSRSAALVFALTLSSASHARAQRVANPAPVPLTPPAELALDLEPTPWGDIAHPNRRRDLRALQDAWVQLRTRAEAGGALRRFILGEGPPPASYESLRDEFQVLADALPDDPSALVGLAYVYWELHDDEAGLRALRRAEALPGVVPERHEILFRIGIVTTRLERFAESRDAYEAMLRYPLARTSRAIALGNLAETYLYVGRPDLAVQDYEQSLALVPSDPGASWGLVSALDRSGRVDDARRAAAQAIRLDPELDGIVSPNVFFVPPYEVHYYLGLAYEAKGQLERDLGHAASATRQLDRALAEWLAYTSLARSDDPWRDRAEWHIRTLREPTAAATPRRREHAR